MSYCVILLLYILWINEYDEKKLHFKFIFVQKCLIPRLGWFRILLFVIKVYVLTFLPASLLCKFISGCAFFGLFLLFLRSLASTKVLEKVIPKSTLSLHPLHWKYNLKLYFEFKNVVHMELRFKLQKRF